MLCFICLIQSHNHLWKNSMIQHATALMTGKGQDMISGHHPAVSFGGTHLPPSCLPWQFAFWLLRRSRIFACCGLSKLSKPQHDCWGSTLQYFAADWSQVTFCIQAIIHKSNYLSGKYWSRSEGEPQVQDPTLLTVSCMTVWYRLIPYTYTHANFVNFLQDVMAWRLSHR